MKTPLSVLPRLLLSLVCLTLSSCKESQQIQKQLTETTTKVAALQAELAQIEVQVASFRAQFPSALANEQIAKQQTLKLAAGVVAIEGEITQTQASIQEAETALESVKKSLEALRVKAPH